MLFERHQSGENAVLVYVELVGAGLQSSEQEFTELVRSAGASVNAGIRALKVAPHPQTLIRSGKLSELLAAIHEHCAELVIFSCPLSPSQQRNLERHCQCRVIDRTSLILDIFAMRARTHEGKLQVELAQLDYMATRLIRGWTHLERQKGGIGLRGPGETQLETDRRLIRQRIKSLQQGLQRVRKQRQLGRRARQRSAVPTVSLVGYTNAGKSTLFNQLCGSEVYAADQLFATLDPTLRRIALPEVGEAVLADTVGFIRDLPHKLVAAFQATLEEVAQAQLLLHVIDAADEERDSNYDAVQSVLGELHAEHVPTILVYNKVDMLREHEPRIERDASGQVHAVWCSARTGLGLELLQQALVERLSDDMVHASLPLGEGNNRLRAQLYAMHSVLSEEYDEQGGCVLEIRAPQAELRRLFKSAELDWSQLQAY